MRGWWEPGVGRAMTKSGISVAGRFQKTGVGRWSGWWQNLALSGGGGGGKIWHCGGGGGGGKNWRSGGKNWLSGGRSLPVFVTCPVTCQGRFLSPFASPASPVFVARPVTCFSGFCHLWLHLFFLFLSHVLSPVLSPASLASVTCLLRSCERLAHTAPFWICSKRRNNGVSAPPGRKLHGSSTIHVWAQV